MDQARTIALIERVKALQHELYLMQVELEADALERCPASESAEIIDPREKRKRPDNRLMGLVR